MRAIVLSDSHGDIYSCEKAIEASGKIDMIIHLGDIYRDCEYIESFYDDIPFEYVIGNNDFYVDGDHEKVIEFDGHRIFICHGHTLRLSGNDSLLKRARENDCEAVLYGHTHVAKLLYEDGIMILNPGSTSRARKGNNSFAILESENGKLSACIVDWVL